LAFPLFINNNDILLHQ